MDVVLNSMSREIVEHLLDAVGPVTTKWLAETLDCTPRMVRYRMEDVAMWFSCNGVKLQKARNKGYWITLEECTRQELKTALQSDDSYHNIFSPEERQRFLMVLFLGTQVSHSTQELMDIVGVSRGTLVNDVRELRKKLIKWDLELNILRGKGYSISGSEANVRQALAETVLELWSEPSSSGVRRIPKQFLDVTGARPHPAAARIKVLQTADAEADIAFFYNEVERIESELGAKFADAGRLALVIHLAVAVFRVQSGNPISLNDEQLEALKSTEHFASATKLAERVERRFQIEFPVAEAAYITLHLLGAKRSVPEDQFSRDCGCFSRMAHQIIQVAERLLECTIVDETLLAGLTTHLIASYYRVKHDLPIRNPLLDQVKESYPDIYEVATEACRALSEPYGILFPEEEIAYITMHIGAAIERMNRRKVRKTRVAVVCAGGLGTASLLSSQMEARFPHVEVVGMYPAFDLEKHLPSNVDAIVSTVEIGVPNIPCAVVNPVWGFKDIKAIESLLNLIPTVSDPKSKEQEDASLPTIKLKKQAIRFKVKCSNWMDAVRTGGQILVENGFSEKRYIDAMVRQIETHGSYIVFQGGVALPHAAPLDGVLKPGMSLVRLSEPVIFPGMEHEPVMTIVCLALTKKIAPTELVALRRILLQDNAREMGAAETLSELMDVLGELVETP
ncbi:MAG: BglG family transcription antiterminator [Bacillota bacterium]|jgi:mannitol operon transcriptional antiterminator